MKINFPFYYQLRIYFSKTELRQGVCSLTEEEEPRHILLWDFDNDNRDLIAYALKEVQNKYKLSDIYIVSSSPYSYHAYCFTAVTLKTAINILSSTPFVDLAYLRLGMVRGYYTLRISPRQNEAFTLSQVLRSENPPNVAPDIVTVNEYWTTNIKTGVYKNAKR